MPLKIPEYFYVRDQKDKKRDSKMVFINVTKSMSKGILFTHNMNLLIFKSFILWSP